MCKIFNIGRTTIYRWKALKRKTGDIKAKPYGPAKDYNARIDLKEFEELIINNHDKTAKELSIMLGNRLQKTRINYYRKLLGYTYKKNSSSSKKGCWFKIKNEIRKLTSAFKDITMAAEHVLKFI